MVSLIVTPFTSTGASASTETLPAQTVAAMKRFGLPMDSISVYVSAPDLNTKVLTYRAGEPRNPASVMKLVTTFAALDLLGPDYNWHTEFLIDAPIKDGILDGNLYIRAGGDPMILVEDLLRMLHMLRQRGLRDIQGDLVVDSSIFDENSIDRDPIDDQRYRAYNAYPGAMVVNFRATRFLFVPRENGIDIIADPPASTLKIDNRLKAVDGPCRGGHRKVRMDVQSTKPTVVQFSGAYPRSCGEHELTRTILPQAAYLYGVIKALWTDLGGRLTGRLVSGNIPETATSLMTSPSRPLVEVLRGINKYSNNMMARNLLLSIGAKVYQKPGTVASGRVAIQSWLHTQGIPLPHLALVNGAGLSRSARISATGLGTLLEAALKHPYRDEYLSSLSLVGVDGSVRKRFRDSDETGRYRMKTGLLNGVRAVAGYGLTQKNTQLVIVIIQNSPTLNYTNGNAVQDTILTWLHNNF